MWPHGAEEQARKVGMHSLVPRNKLVAERQDRHQATFLKAEDRGERSTEEDTLNCERDEMLHESRARIRDPAKSPTGFPPVAWDGFYGVKEMLALKRALNVGVNEQQISF